MSKERSVFTSSFQSLIFILLFTLVFFVSISFYDSTEYSKSVFQTAYIPFLFCLINKALDLMFAAKDAFIDVYLMTNKTSTDIGRFLWHDINSESSGTYCKIMNTGNTQINTINIVVNPGNVKEDSLLNVFFPIKPNEALYIDLSIPSHQIKEIVVQYHSGGKEKKMYFSGKQVVTAHGIAFSNFSQEGKYKFNKVKHKIPLQRTVLGPSTALESSGNDDAILSSPISEIE